MLSRVQFRLALIAVAFVALALPAPAAQPIQVSLQNSRLASFDINCAFFCFPSDNITISTCGNHQRWDDQARAPITSALGTLPFATFTVLANHQIDNGDGSPSFLKSYLSAPVSGGDLSILIIGDNLTNYSFNYPIVANNQFVFEFFWTFLGIPATFTLHPITPYSGTVQVFLGNPPDPDAPPPPPPPCHCGMTGYSFNMMPAGLWVLSDTPLSYNPPRGRPMDFTLTYNQRDVNQPTIFPSSNVGPQWTFNGLTYISAGPVTGQIEAVRYLPGRGTGAVPQLYPKQFQPGCL